MDADSFERYLSDRYEDQTSWYQEMAARNKSRYQIFQWGIIILAAIVPVLVAVEGAGKFGGIWWLTIIASVLLAIGTAGVKTFSFQENWISYRVTAERLIQEKVFYDGKIGEYGTADDRETLFVERIETLISSENAKWMVTQTAKKKNGE